MVARGRGGASEPEAIRDLVSRLTNATNRRERSKGGTREFREADEARLRYRHILLDDDLFERFIGAEGPPAKESAQAREDAQAREGTRRGGGAPQRRQEAPKRRQARA
jgi:hypothetical protein